MVWLAVVAVGAGFGALLLWGTRGAPNDPAESGGVFRYLNAPPLMDDSDRGVMGPSDADVEEANRVAD